MKKIKIILGTMQFGERVFNDDAIEILNLATEQGITEIDTAYVYNDGQSEKTIGEFVPKGKSGVHIATKANPRITGRLDKEAVIEQCNESLVRLNKEYVDLFYLHFPDPNTPLESALEGVAELHKEGKIKELGLSNFPAWMVAEAYNICKSKGWILPTVYEGLYNPLSRNIEKELDMALNHYGMRLYVYNPLAGGLLTDKYLDKEIKEGRFVNRPNYQKRYWHDSFFKAIKEINDECTVQGINIAEASLRWLCYHSILSSQRGDGIILGVSSKEQLNKNIEFISKGELPSVLANKIEAVWEECKKDAPEYFTLYKK